MQAAAEPDKYYATSECFDQRSSSKHGGMGRFFEGPLS
jgi:hypothetical protein